MIGLTAIARLRNTFGADKQIVWLVWYDNWFYTCFFLRVRFTILHVTLIYWQFTLYLFVYSCHVFIFVVPLVDLTRTKRALVYYSFFWVSDYHVWTLITRQNIRVHRRKYLSSLSEYIENNIHSCRTDGTFLHVGPWRCCSSFAIDGGIQESIRESTCTCNRIQVNFFLFIVTEQ